MWKVIASLIVVMILSLGSCSDNGGGQSAPDPDLEVKRLSKIFALPASVKAPLDNPMSEAKVKLGKLLFHDPILSGERDVACATCHHPNNGFAESRDLSIGVSGKGFGQRRVRLDPEQIPLVKRNAHTVLNTAFNGIDFRGSYQPDEAPMFWDSRAHSLEAQALLPLQALEEMRGVRFTEEEILPELVRRLRDNQIYVDLFADAFPGESIDTNTLAKAIASYERTLVANHSRFDAFKRGDQTALSQSEKDGMKLFLDAGCAACHNGPMFSDFKMHVLGVPNHPELPELDRGFEDRFAFRTPTLRNLRFTFPFMHNGSFKSIREILEFYQDISQGKSRNPAVPIDSIDPLARNLKLKARDFAPIENFLLSLNDDSFDQSIPEEVPSGLPVAGNIN